MLSEIRDVVFVDGVRTPFGKAGSLYAETRADDLVVNCIRELLRRHPELPPERVDEVAIAATTQIGDQGLTIGRTAALLAGLPRSVPGFAIDRMCAGAMTAVTTVASGIAFGAYDVAIAGGVEHMGHHPMGVGVDPNPRFVAEKLVDQSSLIMGATAENLHDRYPAITRDRADAYAVLSQDRVPAGVRRRGHPGVAGPGRHPQRASSAGGWPPPTSRPGPAPPVEALAALRTPFRPHGRVTAGNAAGLNDGATACLLAGADVAAELGLPAAMRLVGFAFAGVDPEVMGVGPIPSTEKALAKAGLTIDDIGAFEINEAFAVQVLAFLDHFGIDAEDPRVNPYGGAIALGHPLASSGVRLMIHLARTFREHPEVRYGITTMCIGLGMGGTVIWENPLTRDDSSTPALAEGRRMTPDELSALVESRRGAWPTARSSPTPCSRDVALPHGAGTAVLDHPGQRSDHSRPNTLGPRGLGELGAAIDAAAARDDVAAIAVTGKPFILAAGADLSGLPKITEREQALAIARIGHAVFDKLHATAIPTFALINGMALGGGLEIGAALRLPDGLGRGRRHRPARVLPRHVPGLGRRLPAAQPDRRRARRAR